MLAELACNRHSAVYSNLYDMQCQSTMMHLLVVETATNYICADSGLLKVRRRGESEK